MRIIFSKSSFEQQTPRNGTTKKNLITESGVLEIEVPRDRTGTFEPELIPKRSTRVDGARYLQ